MAINRIGKAAAAVAMVAGLTLATAGAASAGTVTWNGVRGLDSIDACEAGEAPYLHWILTPGGGNSVTGATLELDGTSYVGIQHGEGGGAWHFYTPSDVDLSSASATYTGTIGRNALLTISDGCVGDGGPSS
jgi:hypothetical protein